MAPKRGQRMTDVWTQFSFSKLRTLYNCPLQFWFQYVLKLRTPQTPVFAVGSALHYLAHLYYRRRYKSAETFAGAWKGFWAGVLNNEHGPEAYDSEPVEIAWQDPAHQNVWYGKGAAIMSAFYHRHADLRLNAAPGVVFGAMSERRFKTRWQGFSLVGVMDRIDEYPDGVEVVDYKMGKEYPMLVAASLQPLFYQIGYEQCLRQRYFNSKLYRGFRIENLFTGESQTVPPAAADRLRSFYEFLVEARSYIRGILDTATPESGQPLSFMHPCDVSARQFRPKLPKGLHCKYCMYISECDDWIASRQPSPRDIWIERMIQAYRQLTPQQNELPLEWRSEHV